MNKYKPARTTVARKPGVARKSRPQSGRRRRVGSFLPKGSRRNPIGRRRRRGLVPRGPRRVDIMKIKGPRDRRRPGGNKPRIR